MKERRAHPPPLDAARAATTAVIDAYELKIKVLEAQIRMVRWDLDKTLIALAERPAERPLRPRVDGLDTAHPAEAPTV